ncbi:MAG: hypothetical protein WC781_05150 [Candidatus Pacearchaeota archaeon]|jgi:hypothetical protein
MFNKRGQFYLIAAVIIIIILFGLSGVTNYIKTKTPEVQTYELSKELNLESESVINYGLYNSKDTNTLLASFAGNFTDYLSQDSDVYFVYGDDSKITVLGYTRVAAGSISINFGDSAPIVTEIPGRKLSQEITTATPDRQVSVIISGKTYDFTLKQGQNFYFLITQPSQDV